MDRDRLIALGFEPDDARELQDGALVTFMGGMQEPDAALDADDTNQDAAQDQDADHDNAPPPAPKPQAAAQPTTPGKPPVAGKPAAPVAGAATLPRRKRPAPDPTAFDPARDE